MSYSVDRKVSNCAWVIFILHKNTCNINIINIISSFQMYTTDNGYIPILAN